MFYDNKETSLYETHHEESDDSSGLLFENLVEEKKKEDEKKPDRLISSVFDRIFSRVERVLIVLLHEYLSEVEAASYLRLSDPEGEGRSTIRNYALRSKTLTFAKIGRNGLIFSKTDLDNFLRSKKVITHQDV